MKRLTVDSPINKSIAFNEVNDETMIIETYYVENSVPCKVRVYVGREDAIRIVEFLREEFRL